MEKLFTLIKESCEKYKDKEAIFDRQDTGIYRTYTFKRLLENMEKFRWKLEEAAIRSGDRIGLIAENSPEWVFAFLAITASDCTAVLIDPALSEFEINDFIGRSDLRGIMMSPDVRGKLGHDRPIQIPTFNIKNNAAPFAGDESCLKIDYPETPDPDTEVAAILYSSGTTSTAKGVMQTHDGIRVMALKNIENNLMTDNDRILAVVPVYHIMGFMSNIICTLLCGASMCFIETINSINISKAFLEYKPTGMACVPRVYSMFGNKIMDTVRSRGKLFLSVFNILFYISYGIRKLTGLNAGRLIFKSVHDTFGGNIRGFLSGGSLLEKSTYDLFYGLGFYFLTNYGITETNIPITTNNFSHFSNSCGFLISDAQLRIVEFEGSDYGEIQVKSPGIMKGYFRDAETTKAAFTEDGWFRTGDLGYMDKRNNLYIAGRIKENIVLATGKKISPNDMERCFNKVEGISDFIICGISRNSGAFDEIHAFIVKDKANVRPDSEIEADMFRINNSMPGFMKVNRFHIINEIPKTAIQKPKRYLLKMMVLSSEAAEESAATSTNDCLSYGVGCKYYNEVLETASKFNYPGVKINQQTKLFEDIGFDSLTATEFCHQLESLTGKNIASILSHNITINDIVIALNSDIPINENESMLSGFPYARSWFDILVFKLFRAWSGLTYSIDIKGVSNIPGHGGFLICPNHETHLDAFFILSHLPPEIFGRFCCMAKKEHLDNAFGRLMLRIGGGIPVDRHNNPAPAFERCLKKLKEGWVVLIHPEGTRTRDGNLGEFKKGAAKLALESSVPIVPVRINGGFDVYPTGKLLPRLFDFKNFKRYKLSIIIDKPISPKGQDADKLTHILKERVAGLGYEL